MRDLSREWRLVVQELPFIHWSTKVPSEYQSMPSFLFSFIVNLAFSDLLLCTFTAPATLYLTLNLFWPLGNLTCQVVRMASFSFQKVAYSVHKLERNEERNELREWITAQIETDLVTRLKPDENRMRNRKKREGGDCMEVLPPRGYTDPISLHDEYSLSIWRSDANDDSSFYSS